MGNQDKGTSAFFRGLAAEGSVTRIYQARGYQLEQQRWRTSRCEIDLIFRQNNLIVFVEVKASAKASFVAERYSNAQMMRQVEAAQEYLGKDEAYALLDVRFDLALVDRVGAVDILENVLL